MKPAILSGSPARETLSVEDLGMSASPSTPGPSGGAVHSQAWGGSRTQSFLGSRTAQAGFVLEKTWFPVLPGNQAPYWKQISSDS